jgi:uroporphyrinogen-III synthase
LDRDSKSLAGKRILVTRAPEQAQELIAALEELGASVSLLPMIAFAPPESWQKLDKQLGRLDLFDAIVFLSKNAVRYIFDRCAQLGIKCEMLAGSNRFIAAVGPATARALGEKGIRVNYVAQKGTAEALVQELGTSLAGRRVLLPRSDRGDERAPRALREAGADVTEVIAYRTIESGKPDPEVIAGIDRNEFDAIIFASPSAFQNFRSAVGATEIERLSPRIDFVAIGPTTARAIRDAGVRVAVQAEDASATGLARAIVDHYQRHPATARPA